MKKPHIKRSYSRWMATLGNVSVVADTPAAAYAQLMYRIPLPQACKLSKLDLRYNPDRHG